MSQTKNGRPSAVTPPEAHSRLSNRRLSTVQRGWSELWVVTWAASAMDRLERKLSGAVFNASIPQPKCTEYSPPVHHFTLPAPEYRRSHVAVKFSSQRRGGRDINRMLRSILLRSGRGGQTGRTKYCAELTTITASRYRARASRPSARKKVASQLLD